MPFYNFFGKRAADVWIALFVTHLMDLGETMGELLMICICIVLFGIPSICIGWVLQCVVVVIRDKKSKDQKLKIKCRCAPVDFKLIHHRGSVRPHYACLHVAAGVWAAFLKN
jgi:hypothetical protein